MKLIQKGNRQLRVDDVRAEQLLAAGYVEIDQKTGKPIIVETEAEKAEKAAKKELADLKKENAELQKENAELKEKLAKATKAKKPAEKEDEKGE